jgi:hypothetical protein
MRIRFLVIVLCLSACAYGQTNPRAATENLRSQLKGNVRTVEILRMPDEVLTRVNVSPEQLPLLAHYTVTLNAEFESSIGSLLSAADPKPGTEDSDLRWGVLFRDASGREIGAIFVDRFGKKGYVNKEKVIFGSNLAKRLRQIIRDLR